MTFSWKTFKPILTWLTDILLIGRNAGLWAINQVGSNKNDLNKPHSPGK